MLGKLELAESPIVAAPRGGVWRVPGTRNSHFTGRERALGEIHQHFKQDKPTPLAIVGLGGVGKTQIAAEFAWRYRNKYSVVWWIAADDPTTLALSYAQLAKRLGMRVADSDNLDAIRHAFRRALGQISGWLLIFDNAPSADAVRDYLPLLSSETPSGHVLITSRDTDWADTASVRSLRVMERDESIEFLMRRVGARGQEKIAGRVAQALGDHPLAMEQAGAHIVESRINFETYLKRFESHWAELLADGTGFASPGAEYPDSLAMSLELSYRQLEEAQPTAQSLLNLFAFFSGESIPPWVMETAETVSAALPVSLMPVVMDRDCREDALAALARYSLIERDGEDLHIHRLVSALARRRLSTIEKADLASASLRIVTTAFDFDSQDPQSWPVCAAVLPHALEAAAHAESLGIELESAAKVMNVAGGS